MIERTTGDILDAKTDAVVNTVNTVGVMGKGIALQFRQAFPENYRLYRSACDRGEVVPGKMFLVHTGLLSNPRIIVNFPTKRHWKGKSRMEDIEAGLEDLVRVIRAEEIRSIAIPPLGCGNGGLDWNQVRPRIEKALAAVPEVRALLYEPAGAPPPETMKVRTDPPAMTRGRAALLGILDEYALPGYRLSLLEVQKLAYFLQVAGEPMRLRFEKGKFGPYAESLNHVLQRLEGHFLRGYGDRSQQSSLQLLPSAAEQAQTFLAQSPEVLVHLRRVAELIEGYETPYGLELLSSIHWLIAEEGSPQGEILERLGVWNERKARLFQPIHVELAWARLQDRDWTRKPGS